MLDHHRHAPRPPHLRQPYVDGRIAGGVGVDADVVGGAVAVEAYRRLAEGRPVPQHDTPVRIELLLVDLGRPGGEPADRQVDLARTQHGAGLLGRDLEGADRAPGRPALQGAQQFGQEQDLPHLGHADGQGALGLGRLERRLAQQAALDQAHDLADPRRQPLGPGRGHDPRAATDEQRVAEKVPQPAQRMADAALRHVERRGGAGDVPILQQRVEDGDQVEV